MGKVKAIYKNRVPYLNVSIPNGKGKVPERPHPKDAFIMYQFPMGKVKEFIFILM